MILKLIIQDKSFGEQKVFSNTSIEIDEGAFLAIKGPFGSGKTTL